MLSDNHPPAAFVLLVEDTSAVAKLLQTYLERDGHRVAVAATGGEALRRLRAEPPDVVVLDLTLPDLHGREVLAEVGRIGIACSVVVVTADGSLETAVEAMRAGAYDFVAKPVNADRLRTTVRNALERTRLHSRVELLERNLGRERFHGFTGASLAMQGVYRTLEIAAPSNATVLITGESGTGKELAAEALHQLSPRRAKPLVTLNCAAIPKDLIETEIFGHVRGAFTGAVSDRPGAARQADGGTLFLDEICETHLDLQAKLLRFLQTGTFQPVGGSHPGRVNVRIVCATNRDPWAEVQAGRFREDLYYRLNVIPLHMPPLRERGEDVLLIARELLRRYASEERRRFQRLASAAEAVLLAHDWPGNVRELQNALRRAVVMHDGESLTQEMLPLFLKRAALEPAPPPVPQFEGALPAREEGEGDYASVHAWQQVQDIVSLVRLERAAIERALGLCGGNVPRAAAFLGVSPSTLYRKRQSWSLSTGPTTAA